MAGCRQKMTNQYEVVRLVSSAEMMGYETEIVILFLVLEDCILVVENGSSRLASRNIGSIGLLFSCVPCGPWNIGDE